MRPLICLLTWLTLAPAAFATHILGGYIRTESASSSGNTVLITVTLYSDLGHTPPTAGVDQVVFVCFGDGTVAQLPRIRPVLISTDKSVAISQFRSIHTYAGPGVYQIRTTAVNRTSTIRNINGGLAVDQPFALEATVQIGPLNQMPVLALPSTGLQVPLNQRLVLSLASTDADGDSLSYRLTYPATSQDPYTVNAYCTSYLAVSNYQFPNEVRRVGTFRLNAKTGLLIWDLPTEQGMFCVVILVSEWRNGLLISQTQQELLFLVTDKGGTPVTPPAYEPVDLGVLTATSLPDRDALQLTVSPNPAPTGFIQVELKTIQPTAVTLQLLNAQGRLHETVAFPPATVTHRHTFDLSQQPAGLYLIRAESNGQQVVKKVAKQ